MALSIRSIFLLAFSRKDKEFLGKDKKILLYIYTFLKFAFKLYKDGNLGSQIK